jgi:hypothetical protein
VEPVEPVVVQVVVVVHQAVGKSPLKKFICQ